MVLTGRTVAAVLACGSGFLAACATDSEVMTPPDPPTGIVATTSIWGEIASNVACGEAVPTLVPAGADPHTFEPSLRDRQLLDNAEIVIANGGGLEGPLTDLLDTVQQSGTEVVEMTPLVELIADDPHIWQDPRRVVATIRELIAAAVTTGLDADAVGECADRYVQDLLQLDAEITELLAPIPPENRIMVTSHDSLAYFADRYDLRIVGTVIPSTNTLAETNAADLATLADTIDELGVQVVFTEQLESSNDADRLAERLGVRIVPLVTDALTEDASNDSYIGMMRSNATVIAEALAP